MNIDVKALSLIYQVIVLNFSKVLCYGFNICSNAHSSNSEMPQSNQMNWSCIMPTFQSPSATRKSNSEI